MIKVPIPSGQSKIMEHHEGISVGRSFFIIKPLEIKPWGEMLESPQKGALLQGLLVCGKCGRRLCRYEKGDLPNL
jgi:hypothetical protein